LFGLAFFRIEGLFLEFSAGRLREFGDAFLGLRQGGPAGLDEFRALGIEPQRFVEPRLARLQALDDLLDPREARLELGPFFFHCLFLRHDFFSTFLASPAARGSACHSNKVRRGGTGG